MDSCTDKIKFSKPANNSITCFFKNHIKKVSRTILLIAFYYFPCINKSNELNKN